MKELLDEQLQEQAPKWWHQFSLFFYWKVYLMSFLVAMGILLMLFMRNSRGSDFDALMAIGILWAIMFNLFRQVSKSFFAGAILSFVMMFFVFLKFVHYLVAWLHGMSWRDVTYWKWSHYELLFGDNIYLWSGPSFRNIPEDIAILSKLPRTIETTLIESTEWLLFYAFLTIVITELLHLFNLYNSAPRPKK